jgi:hypothetical protein
MRAIKNCPFCGSPGKLTAYVWPEKTAIVGCKRAVCPAETLYYKGKGATSRAITAWNRRSKE